MLELCQLRVLIAINRNADTPIRQYADTITTPYEPSLRGAKAPIEKLFYFYDSIRASAPWREVLA